MSRRTLPEDIVYTESLDFDKAEADFQEAIELDPDFVASYFNSAYSSGVEIKASPSFLLRTTSYGLFASIRS